MTNDEAERITQIEARQQDRFGDTSRARGRRCKCGFICSDPEGTTIRVTHDELAKSLIDTGKNLIELGMALRAGFEVPIEAAAHD